MNYVYYTRFTYISTFFTTFAYFCQWVQFVTKDGSQSSLQTAPTLLQEAMVEKTKSQTPLKEENTAGRRVKAARILGKLSRKDIEERSNVSSHTLQAWELERNPLTRKGADKLVDAFSQAGIECSAEWLLSGIGLGPRLSDQTTRVVHRASQTSTIDWDKEAAIQSEIETFQQSNPNSVVVMVSDDAMEPIYQIGDYVGGSQLTGDEITSCQNQDCIIETADGIFFRRLIKRKDGYALASINPKTNNVEPVIFTDEIIRAAPVVWHRSKFPVE